MMIKWKNHDEAMEFLSGKEGKMVNLLIKRYKEETMESIRKKIQHTITIHLHDMKSKKYPKEVIKHFTDKYYDIPDVDRKKQKKHFVVHKHGGKTNGNKLE